MTEIEMDTCSYQKTSIEVEGKIKLSLGNLEKLFMRLLHRLPHTNKKDGWTR